MADGTTDLLEILALTALILASLQRKASDRDHHCTIMFDSAPMGVLCKKAFLLLNLF